MAPTEGAVYIEGYDAQRNLQKIRERIGFCPQHNTLFDNLSVIQHLKFFCKVRF